MGQWETEHQITSKKCTEMNLKHALFRVLREIDFIFPNNHVMFNKYCYKQEAIHVKIFKHNSYAVFDWLAKMIFFAKGQKLYIKHSCPV